MTASDKHDTKEETPVKIRSHLLKTAAAALPVLALTAGLAAAADSDGALVYNLQPVVFPYMAAQTAGVEQGAKEHNIKLVNANSNGSLETQISQVKAAVAARRATLPTPGSPSSRTAAGGG